MSRIFRAGNRPWPLLVFARPMKPSRIVALLLLLHVHELRATGFPPADEAFAAGLWEVAALRYEARLSEPGVDAAEKQALALKLAESLVRKGDAMGALELLGQSWLTDSPTRDFWKAQAMAGMGRFADAVGEFKKLLESDQSIHLSEASFTCANLQLSLGMPEEALATLESLVKSSVSPARIAAAIQRAAILIDLGRYDEAHAIMPTADEIPSNSKFFARLLDAKLLLAKEQPTEAAAIFRGLLAEPTGQSMSNYHAAALGLADALAAEGSSEEASLSLLVFIQANPESPLLDPMFKRLLAWLPDVPTSSDPVLERLSEWIPPVVSPVTGLVTVDDSSISAWSISAPISDLTTFSLYTRAVGLNRMDSPAAKFEADKLLLRLIWENPGHFLTGKALIEIGRQYLKEGDLEQAIHLFMVIRENTKSPRLRGEAAFMQARLAFAGGNTAEAQELFKVAAVDLDQEAEISARFNAAISHLEAGGVQLIQQIDALSGDKSLQADLLLERALSLADPAESRAMIEEFLTKFPNHPRVSEARFAAAEAALLSSPPDGSYAHAQLETLESIPDEGSAVAPARMAMVRLRIADLTEESEAAVALAKLFMENHSDDAAAPEAALILGRQLFKSGSYNDARLVFEKLASTDTDSKRAQATWLLASRSAALSATAQSREEALGLFDKAISIDAPLEPVARLEKARLMIDLNLLPQAVVFLREWMGSLTDDSLKLPAGLLLGEAIYAQGAQNPGTLEEALEIYNELLGHAEEEPALFYRLQYLRGMTLEQLPLKDNPSLKREAEALDAYFSVFQAAVDATPTEWEWFERCGFRALGILENGQRWKAAIAVAQKIASFKGPRAEEAATRASQLQLKHMIWED